MMRRWEWKMGMNGGNERGFSRLIGFQAEIEPRGKRWGWMMPTRVSKLWETCGKVSPWEKELVAVSTPTAEEAKTSSELPSSGAKPRCLD